MAKEPEDHTDDDVVDQSDEEVIDDPVGEGDETDESDGESVDDPAGEGDDPDGTDAEFSEEEPPARKQPKGRGDRQFGELRRRNRELEQRLADIERRQPAPAGKSAEELRREEQAKLQYMSPDEKLAYYEQKFEQRLQQQDIRQNFATADANDSRNFERECRKYPQLKALEDDVEDQLARLRNRGVWNYSRAEIARMILAERALKATAKKKPQMKKQAERARQANQAGGGSQKSNVRAGGERGGDEKAKRAKRLENVSI